MFFSGFKDFLFALICLRSKTLEMLAQDLVNVSEPSNSEAH